MSKLRIILGYLFGFVASITLVLLCLLLIAKFTIGDKNYVSKILKDNHYYEKLDEEIKEELGLYILSSGFNDEIIKDIYEYDNLVKDIDNYIEMAYRGKLATINTSSIRDIVTERIKNVLKKNNVTYNNNDVNSFIDGMVNVYSDEVLLYHFTDDVIKYIPKIIKAIDIGIIATSILLVILLIVLIVIKYQYFIATIMSSGLIILFIRLFIFEKIDIDELLIITEKFSEELRIIMNNLQDLLFISAIGMIGLGALGLFIMLIVKLICKPKKSKEENIEIL